MKNLKCKYNWNDGTVDLLFSDGTKITLLYKGIEADLNIGIKAQGKTTSLKGGKAVRVRCDGIKRNFTSLLRHYRPFRPRKPKHPFSAV